MATIWSTAIKFIADTQEFTAGLLKMSKQSKLFSAGLDKDFRNASETLKKVGIAAGLAGAAIATGIAAGTAKAVAELASISDEARKLDMSAAAFQVLGAIAQDAGVEVGTLRQGYVELTKAINEVDKGSSETIQTFNDLGISVDRLKELTPEQKLAAVADKLNALSDVNEKNRVGMALLGKSWTDIKVVLDGGSNAMADAANEAAALGKIMSDEDVGNVKELQKSFNDLEEVLTSAFNVIAATVAPILTEYINQFLNWLKEGTNLSDTFQTALFALTTPFYMLAKAVDGLIAAFYFAKGAIALLGTGVLQFGTWAMKVIATSAKGWEELFNLIITGWNALPFNKNRQVAKFTFSSNIQAFADNLQGTTEELAAASVEAFQKAGDAWEHGYAEKVTDVSGKLTNVITTVTNRGQEAGKKVGESIRNVGTEVTGVTIDFEELLKELERMEGIASRYSKTAAIQKEIDEIQELIQYQLDWGITLADNADLEEELILRQQELFEASNRTFSKFKGVFQSFGDGLADAIMNARSFSDVIKQVEKDLIAVIVRQFILKQMFNMAGSAFGIPALGEMMYGGGRASGGPVQAGVAYTVGEEGRERFVPTTDGVILPNDFGGGAGNTTVNVTLNVETGVSQTVRAEMMNLLPAMKREVMAGVLDAKQRGGYFARTIAA